MPHSNSKKTHHTANAYPGRRADANCESSHRTISATFNSRPLGGTSPKLQKSFAIIFLTLTLAVFVAQKPKTAYACVAWSTGLTVPVGACIDFADSAQGPNFSCGACCTHYGTICGCTGGTCSVNLGYNYPLDSVTAKGGLGEAEAATITTITNPVDGVCQNTSTNPSDPSCNTNGTVGQYTVSFSVNTASYASGSYTATLKVPTYSSSYTDNFPFTVCTPNCSGKTCGDDGCGGSCGSCPTGYTCNAAGQCVQGCNISPASVSAGTQVNFSLNFNTTLPANSWFCSWTQTGGPAQANSGSFVNGSWAGYDLAACTGPVTWTPSVVGNYTFDCTIRRTYP